MLIKLQSPLNIYVWYITMTYQFWIDNKKAIRRQLYSFVTKKYNLSFSFPERRMCKVLLDFHQSTSPLKKIKGFQKSKKNFIRVTRNFLFFLFLLYFSKLLGYKTLTFKNNCCRCFAFARTIPGRKGDLHTYFCLKENK